MNVQQKIVHCEKCVTKKSNYLNNNNCVSEVKTNGNVDESKKEENGKDLR